MLQCCLYDRVPVFRIPKFNGKEDIYARINSRSSHIWGIGACRIGNHHLSPEAEIFLNAVVQVTACGPNETRKSIYSMDFLHCVTAYGLV